MPWNELLYFDRTVQDVKLSSIKILTRDKVEVILTLQAFYFIE